MRRLVLALALWIASVLVVGGFAALAIAYDIGESSTTTVQEQTAPDGSLTVTETVSVQTAFPVTHILSLIAAIGTLAIPVKFAWDELGNHAPYRRQVGVEMRERVHRYIEQYYTPMAHALNDLGRESATLRQTPKDDVVFDRWLYSFALVWASRRVMRREGGSWWFQDRQGEYRVSRGFDYVRDLFDASFARHGDERSQLAGAVHGLDPQSFVGFQERLQPPARHRWPPPGDWDALRERRDGLRQKLLDDPARDDRLAELADACHYVVSLVQHYATEMYGDAYTGAVPRGATENLERDTAWVDDLIRADAAAAVLD